MEVIVMVTVTAIVITMIALVIKKARAIATAIVLV